MDVQKQYKSKCRSAAEAIIDITDGDTVVVPTGVGEPPRLLEALSERRWALHDVKVSQILAMRPFAYFDKKSVQHVLHRGYFLGGCARLGAQEGWCDFTPCHFSEIPGLMRAGLLPVDVVVTMASPMDRHGYFSLSLATDYTMQAIKQARVVVLEVNPNVPFSPGDCHVHISAVTAVVEDNAPILEVPPPTIGPVQEAIAGFVAEQIEDGSCLQIGYGAIPDAVVRQLTGKRDLGIHTEMLGDGILDLIECGAVTGARKNYIAGRIISTFALGTKRLYDFMDRNPVVEMHPVDRTNDPYIAGRNDNLISINATLQVDLLGQCGSESLGPLVFSGSGGQVDFVRAANRSRGGKSFIVLPSTAKGDTISRIVPSLSPGTHVTTGKNEIDRVVTEYGVAHLRGKSAQQRARELLAIAHPDHRAELRAGAQKLGLL